MKSFEVLFRQNVESLVVKEWPKAHGRCPFHSDKNPSLFVNLQNGFWKCHAGCGSGKVKDFERRINEQYRRAINESVASRPHSAARLETNSGGRKFQPMRMKDLISLVHELGEDKDEWFWEKLIAAEAVCMLVGSPKAGKSTLLAEAVAAMVAGRPFLGLKTQKIKVLLLGLEERRRDVAKRFEQLGVTKRIRYYEGPMQATVESYRDLAEYVRREGIRLIVIDTLAKFWQVNDENSAAETERALEPIRLLAREQKVAILLLHHSRKGEIMAGESIRGSSAIFASVDASITFKSGKSFSDTERTLQVQSRLSGHWQLRVDYRNGRYRVIGKHDLNERERLMLLTLRRKPLCRAEELGKAVGLEGTTARTACEKLARKLTGKIRIIGSGKKGDPRRYGLKEARNGH